MSENRMPPRQRPFPAERYRPRFSESYEQVCRDLRNLSTRLQDLLPDPGIGPEERLERIARVVPESVRVTAHMQTGRAKLARLRARLDELVPGPQPHMEKLEHLVGLVHELVPQGDRFITKLEQLGDYRLTDTGVTPWYPREGDRHG